MQNKQLSQYILNSQQINQEQKSGINKTLEWYKKNGIFFLGKYKKKFIDLGFNDQQLYDLWLSISHTKELKDIYKKEKSKYNLTKVKNNANEKICDNCQNENRRNENDLFLKQILEKQLIQNSYNEDKKIINENKNCDDKIQNEESLHNSNHIQKNEYDQQNDIIKRFTIDIKILFDKNLSPKEKKDLIMKDIKKKLQEFFKELKIDEKINKLQNSGKNKKQLESVLKQKELICTFLDEKLKNKMENEKINKKNDQEQQLKEEIKDQDFGKIRQYGKQIQFQGDVKDKRMWKSIIERQQSINKDLMFTGIIMDPPWCDTALNLKYQTLKNQEWMDSIPLLELQNVGYLFIWIINSQLENTLAYLQKFNYERVDIVAWFKINLDKIIKDGIGYYLRHNFEMCLVAQKQQNLDLLKVLHQTHTAPSTIVHETQEQSRKPDEIYEIMEILMPNGHYLDIFGRKYNQRENWCTVGNESIELKQQNDSFQEKDDK